MAGKTVQVDIAGSLQSFVVTTVKDFDLKLTFKIFQNSDPFPITAPEEVKISVRRTLQSTPTLFTATTRVAPNEHIWDLTILKTFFNRTGEFFVDVFLSDTADTIIASGHFVVKE